MKIFDKLPWRLQSQLGYRPKGVYGGFEEYQKAYPKKCDTAEVLNSGCFFLNSPKFTSKEMPINFYEVIAQQYAAAKIHTINNASIYMKDYHIGVIAHDNKVIADTTFDYGFKCAAHHPFQSVFKIPKPEKRHGSCLVLAVGGGGAFFWHWMIDAMPKYGLIELTRKNHKDYDYILVNEMLRPFHRQTFEILDIPMRKLVFIKNDCHLAFEKMIIPSQIRYNPWVIHYLRNRFLPNNTAIKKPELNIYVSRQKARWRKVENEDKVFAMLEQKYGFIKVFFEDLTMVEQIKLAQNTKTVVSLVGSNQINMVFCPCGANIIEIQPKGLANVANWILAEQCKHNYTYFECETSNDGDEASEAMKNVVVDVDALGKLLQQIIN